MDAPVKALNTEKAKALQAALAQIEKQFGKGSIMRLGEGEVIEDIQVVSTGSLGLDIALGVGGLPRGRVVEIYGPESSGKTTLTLQVIAEMQKLGGTAAFIDAEHALDIQYAQKLGVNLQELLISQPDTGEQALEIVDALVRSGSVDLIVVDSVAALVPKKELEGEIGDSHVGLQAQPIAFTLRLRQVAQLADQRQPPGQQHLLQLTLDHPIRSHAPWTPSTESSSASRTKPISAATSSRNCSMPATRCTRLPTATRRWRASTPCSPI